MYPSVETVATRVSQELWNWHINFGPSHFFCILMCWCITKFSQELILFWDAKNEFLMTVGPFKKRLKNNQKICENLTVSPIELIYSLWSYICEDQIDTNFQLVPLMLISWIYAPKDEKLGGGPNSYVNFTILDSP